MRAAVMALRECGIARCVCGSTRCCAPDTYAKLAEEVDEIVCVITPASFHAVGQFYQDFSQTTDSEVRELLARRAEGNQT
jgi:predicted phosphoribosyltransferase